MERVVVGEDPEQHDGARDRDGEPEHDGLREAPPCRARDEQPSPVATAICARARDRHLSPRRVALSREVQPDADIKRTTPSSGELRRDAALNDEARR